MKLLECPGCQGLVSANTNFCSACGTRIEQQAKPCILRITALIILLPMAFFGVVTFGNNGKSASTVTQQTPKIAISILSQDEIADAIGAGINQKEENISVVLVVADGTSKKSAEFLGGVFVSEIFALMDSASGTSATLGKGHFNYLVGVYTPNQRPIAVGSKAQNDNNHGKEIKTHRRNIPLQVRGQVFICLK